MLLSEYLSRKDMPQAEFGKLVGVTRDAVAKWLSGDRHPTRKLALKIVKVTNGWVGLKDLYQ